MFSVDQLYGRGPPMLIFSIVTLIVAWFVVTIRLWVRAVMLRAIGTDDILIAVGLLCFTMMSVCSIVMVFYGFGMHFEDLDASTLTVQTKYNYLNQIANVLGLLFTKLSICFFFLRLTPLKWQRRVIYTLAVVDVLTYILATIVTVIQCDPPSFFWTQYEDPTTGHCRSINIAYGIFYTEYTVGVVTDWTLSTLPILLLKDSPLNFKLKFCVCALLGLGYFASATSIVCLVKLKEINGQSDFSWDIVDITIWTQLDLFVALCVASMAAYRPLFAGAAKRLTSLYSRAYQSMTGTQIDKSEDTRPNIRPEKRTRTGMGN